MLRLVPFGEWTAVAPSMSGYSYRQLWSYCLFSARRWRGEPELVGVYENDRCLAMASVRTVHAPFRFGGIAYVSGGPLVPDAGDIGDVPRALSWFVDEYVHDRKMILRIDPPLEWALNDWPVDELLRSAGFVPCAEQRPYRTMVLDLAQSNDELMANCHPRWRGHLRRALRNDLRIEHRSDRHGLETFADIHRRLMTRKGFDVELTPEFYRDVNEHTPPSERFDVLLAYKDDDQPIAGHVGSSLGETSVYLFGASSAEGNQLKASYALQWSAIDLARSRGMRWYDLGGSDPVGNPGVHHFKSRMRGREIVVPGPYECALRGPRAAATRAGELLVRSMRRTRR